MIYCLYTIGVHHLLLTVRALAYRILCVLQRWVQIQYEDFELNPALLKTLKSFLEFDVRATGFRMEAECIEQNIFARVRNF